MKPRAILALAGLLAGLLLSVGGLSLANGPPVAVDDPAPVLPALTAAPSPIASSEPPPALPSATPAPSLGAGWRIAAPRLGIDLPLLDGDIERDVVRQATPVAAAFRFPLGPLPGELGNTYVYAHARRGMFLSLWGARAGDEIVVTRPNGSTLRYVVSELHPRVPADDLEFLQPTEDERLTLQTSTGPSASDPRFVVVARPRNP
jgi:sortase (surface protein transpeptidase)